MPVYNLNGTTIDSVYSVYGNETDFAYSIDGEVVFQSGSWYDEITIEKNRDTASGTNYYVITIPQTRPSGSKQYPFVFVPNGANGGTMATLTMVNTYGFFCGTNGGYFDLLETGSKKPYGINIQNGAVAFDNVDTPSWQSSALYTFTVDSDGKLGYADPLSSGLTAQDLLDDGIVSSVLGLVPLVIDGQPSAVESSQWTSTDRSQRQIIGQYANGDYVIITCEGRNFDSSQGFTVSEARTLCVNMGLEFAMAVDGGGSTETVIEGEQLNTIYEGTYGRIVPTYIVFNGTDEFFVPNA